MQKNPFLPSPSYNPQPPPLPPGPPPQPPPQADYSSYWSSTANHGHGQQPSSGTYSSQWNAPQPAQPPRPPAEQSALYANYGYGGNQSYWQQQQHQRQQQPYQSPHPPPVPQPPPHPPTHQYSQYQPPAPYQPQPYVPHAPGPPPTQQYHPQPQPLQAQPTPPYLPHQPRPSQNQPTRQGSQQFQQPPPKRARFDGGSRSFQQPPQFPLPQSPMPPPGLQAQPTLPNYIPPPPPIQQPLNAQNRGSMRDNRARTNKSGSMNPNRNRPPGQQGNRGNFPNNQNRRNLGGNQGGGSFRNQQRQGNLGNQSGNRSFNAGQQQSRGRNNQRSGRNDGSFIAHGSGSGTRKEEVKRAMTDFKLVAIEIKQLDWSWGAIPSSQDVGPNANRESTGTAKIEADEKIFPEKDPPQSSSSNVQEGSSVGMKAEPSELDSLPPKPDLSLPPVPHTGYAPAVPSPPSRVRIYFHTPVTPKDSMPIPHASAVPVDLSALATSQGSSRKGKRKRTDDEDDDAETRTTHTSAAHQDDAVSVTAHPDQDGFRGSVAPSVVESTGESDWLKAAIGEGSNEGDGSDVSQPPPHDSRMINGVDNDEADDGEVERTIIGPPDDFIHPEDAEAPGQVHANGLILDYVPPPSDDPPGLPTGDPSITDDASAAPDEQPTQQDQPVETDGEDEDESPDFVAFPDDQSSVRDEDHRSASPEPHATFDYGSFTHGRLGPTRSFTSTLGENDSQEVSFSEYGSTLVNEDVVMSTGQKGTQPIGDPARDSLSPTSTLLTAGQEAGDPAAQTGETKTLSANRLAVSYASASRRILIDAKIVNTLRVFRKEHRIEIDFNVEKGDETEIKGITVEVLSEAAKKYTPLQLTSEAYESDPMFPPLLTAKHSSRLNLVIHLDSEKPIPEAKWVKTGDVHEWVRSTFGRIFTDVNDGWEKKIVVQDPDPAPTIRSILDGWAINGNVGSQTERQRFVKTHLSEMDNVLEILLRLIRGERATAFPQSNATVAATRNGVPGPLLAAIEGHAHGAQQTHVSLAVLAMFRMLMEFAKRADGEKGKGEVEERVGEIIRCLPVQLLHKSLEGMFKEWKTEKKGGNPSAR